MFKRIVICVVMVATIGLLMVGFCGNANANANLNLDSNVMQNDLVCKESQYWPNKYLLVRTLCILINYRFVMLVAQNEDQTNLANTMIGLIENLDLNLPKDGHIPKGKYEEISVSISKLTDPDIYSSLKEAFDLLFKSSQK